MKKIFLLRGLDCPNCSAKIEREVGELEGVSSSVVNLMKQTLTISVDVSVATAVAKQIEAIVHNHEPEVEVSEYVVEATAIKNTKSEDSKDDNRKMIFRLISGAVLFAIGIIAGEIVKAPLPVELAFLIISYIILGGDIVSFPFRTAFRRESEWWGGR